LVHRLGAASLTSPFLRATFGPEVEWMHSQGLLTLTGLEAPLELAGWLLGKPSGSRLMESLEAARGVAGAYIAIDGPEYLLAQHGSPDGPAGYVRELNVGLRATG